MRVTLPRCAVLTGVWLVSSLAVAQGRFDLGKRVYDNSCASCHGVAAKGDGPLARYLVKPSPDLTLLARHNGEVFPRDRVAEVIDGRTSTEIGPHGSREMPIWGDVFRKDAGTAGVSGARQVERHAQQRVQALVDYLARLQEK